MIWTLQDFDPEAEVRIAEIGHRTHTQSHLGDVVEVELKDTGYGSQEGDFEWIVYLAAGDQVHDRPYLPKEAREELGC